MSLIDPKRSLRLVTLSGSGMGNFGKWRPGDPQSFAIQSQIQAASVCFERVLSGLDKTIETN